ncbi:MAG: 50S ribosomal protein L6 [bacterium]
MSRIGKNPINIPKGVEVKVQGTGVSVKGSLGVLSETISDKMSVSVSDDQITVMRSSEEKTQKSLHGLTRKLIANMVEGVTKGFEKTLVIQGVGYRAEVKGDMLVLQLGFSHPVEFKIPKGITIKMDGQTKMTISGINKQHVGEVASEIRHLKPPEPYKGKGIRYLGEYVKRKVGKTGVTGAAGGK